MPLTLTGSLRDISLSAGVVTFSFVICVSAPTCPSKLPLTAFTPPLPASFDLPSSAAAACPTFVSAPTSAAVSCPAFFSVPSSAAAACPAFFAPPASAATPTPALTLSDITSSCALPHPPHRQTISAMSKISYKCFLPLHFFIRLLSIRLPGFISTPMLPSPSLNSHIFHRSLPYKRPVPDTRSAASPPSSSAFRPGSPRSAPYLALYPQTDTPAASS